MARRFRTRPTVQTRTLATERGLFFCKRQTPQTIENSFITWYAVHMYLFLLVAIPCLLYGWMYAQQSYERSSYYMPILIGIVSAMLVCTFKSFFVFSTFVWTTSFIRGFLHLLFIEELLPVGLLYGAFIFFSKDDNDFLACAFLPLIASFFAVFLPYRVITMDEELSVFPLFVKPVLFVSMISFLSSLAHRIFNGIEAHDKKAIVKNAIMAFAACCVPPLLESWWHLGGKLLFIIPFAFVYALAAFLVYQKLKQETARKPIFMSM